METKMPNRKRHTINYDLILAQLQMLQHSRSLYTAARKSNTNYATYLARFRRAGVNPREAEMRMNRGEMPEMIAHEAFPDKKETVTIQPQIQLVTDMIRQIVQQELRVA